MRKNALYQIIIFTGIFHFANPLLSQYGNQCCPRWSFPSDGFSNTACVSLGRDANYIYPYAGDMGMHLEKNKSYSERYPSDKLRLVFNPATIFTPWSTSPSYLKVKMKVKTKTGIIDVQEYVKNKLELSGTYSLRVTFKGGYFTLEKWSPNIVNNYVDMEDVNMLIIQLFKEGTYAQIQTESAGGGGEETYFVPLAGFTKAYQTALSKIE